MVAGLVPKPGGLSLIAKDLDVVLSLSENESTRLVDLFPAPDFRFDPVILKSAAAKKGPCPIQNAAGFKIELSFLSETEFDASRFNRKMRADFEGHRLLVCSPEDTILTHLLRGQKSGGSEGQFAEAFRVYDTESERLDHAYIGDWVRRIGVESEFKAMRRGAGSST